jgi:calcium-dependent protein kinase
VRGYALEHRIDDSLYFSQAFEVFENKSQIYIVMEICNGGDLYRRLPYSEKEAAKITAKLCSAIAYMHSKDVVHRDCKYLCFRLLLLCLYHNYQSLGSLPSIAVKFENVMFESTDSDSEVKVIDFGLSKKFLPEVRGSSLPNYFIVSSCAYPCAFSDH